MTSSASTPEGALSPEQRERWLNDPEFHARVFVVAQAICLAVERHSDADWPLTVAVLAVEALEALEAAEGLPDDLLRALTHAQFMSDTASADR